MSKSFYHSFAQPAMLALARAGNRGCRVDVKLRKTLVEKALLAAAVATESLTKLLGRKVNPNSPKQVKELFYEEFRLPVQKSRPIGGYPGKPTTNDEALTKLQRLFPEHSEVISAILSYRGETKRAAMLSVPLEVRNGESYFVTSYNATGTTTGRISSSGTILKLGGNIQNQERGPSRRVFIARKGMVFVKSDSSQAESRVVAALCRDEALLEKFSDPEFDIHLENAQLIYGGTLKDLAAEDLERSEGRLADSKRRRAKGVTHGANYRGGPRVAVKQAGVPYSEAKMAIGKYRATHPLLLRWWDSIETMLLSTRQLRSTWGRLRIFLNRMDESTLKAAVAHEPQSTVGDLINHAFFRLDEELALLDAWPLLQAHDEIVCECWPEDVEAVAALMKKYFEWPMTFKGIAEPLIIPSDLATGLNWYDLEKS